MGINEEGEKDGMDGEREVRRKKDLMGKDDDR